jgi:putative transposase
MVTKSKDALAYERGLFRYGVISELLSRPPVEGELATRLREMAERYFVTPWDKESIKISVRTLERWYSAARKAERPSEILQPKIRTDRGNSRSLTEEHRSWLMDYRMRFPSWSVQLLFDNMMFAEMKSKIPSYSTVLRYLKKQGFHVYSSRNKKHKAKEIRSYEVEFVGQMWHMDFHKGSRMVVTESGEFKQPICMAIVDDKSRLVCHVQWFLNETAEVLVHGLIQAILKRGLPRTFYSDNGSAMKAEEFKAGLIALDIKQENTLPYAAYQNGKQESFWQPLEGRLIKMLPKHKRLTLDVLNAVTQAWVEQDYHVKIHSEINQTPYDRFFNSTNVLRPAPEYNDLKCSFRMQVTRTVRSTDATLTLDGVRFQLPECYAHMKTLLLRYARWDLGEAEIICPDTHKSVGTIHPLDKLANSFGARKEIEEKLQNIESEPSNENEFLDLSTDHLPPLLAQCLKKYSEKYPLGGYIPMQNKKVKTNE